MNAGELTLTSGALAMLLIEAIKFVYRKFIAKDMNVDLPALFYGIATPVLSAVAPFLLVALGVPSTDPILTMDVQGVLVYVLRTAVTALVAFVSYNQGLKPIKSYARAQSAEVIKFN